MAVQEKAPKMTYMKNEKGLFVCPTCGETKARQNTMFYHMKKHAGDFSHACTQCDAKFIQKSGLVQHMMQAHPTGAEPVWNCPCCDHSSKMKANLLIHIGRKHGEGWIPVAAAAGDCTCSGCKRGFGSVTAYYYHAVQCFTAPENLGAALSSLLA